MFLREGEGEIEVDCARSANSAQQEPARGVSSCTGYAVCTLTFVGIAMRLRSALASSVAAFTLGLPACYVAAQPSAATPVVIGQRLQLRSRSMGDVRPYLVHRPANYDISNARYPVLVVLDGESLFQHASATADLLTAAGKIPPMPACSSAPWALSCWRSPHTHTDSHGAWDSSRWRLLGLA